MKQKYSLLILSILFCPFIAISQQSWIIQLKDGHTETSFSQSWPASFFRSTKKIQVRSIGSQFGIYELNAATELTKKDILSNPTVLYAELNQPLETRATPNDPLISQQWALETIGAIKAWDQTQGGITFNKDTLVLGVIDFGFLTTHDDLKNRIWKNKAEIAGNGKDDDNNGYIDDVNGLSLKYKNEKHPADNSSEGLNNHGTSVAGVMCAEGNNRTGITGMMWNSKMMLTTFTDKGTIAELIECFNYILEQRVRYNISKGKQGALVVAINYSGGFSFAKAEDYPIWCSMYDKMGAAGIVNIGATTNKYVDVDDEGDMPSTCPSEFLIAVTNTDKTDKRVYTAGFGLKHIDLGAPGEAIQSTRSAANNSYGTASGTSFSSPLVAGAVGLMYSYPCKEWADYILSNPVEATRIIKKSILASVDKNADLTGKTVSGGRLNIARALDTLKKYVCNRVITSTGQSINIKTIYPNPASSYLQIQLDSNQSGLYQFQMFDMLGKMVIGMNDLYINQQIQVNLPSLAQGVYVIRLSSEKGKANKRILISQ